MSVFLFFWVIGQIYWSVDVSVFLLIVIALALIAAGLASVRFRRKKMGWPARLTVASAWLGLAVLCVVQGFILSRINAGPSTPPTTIIVPGARLNGSVPSLVLQNRLALAADLWWRYPDARMVVCGGQGPDELMSEAVAMRDWLIGLGVPGERILAEANSTNTYENLKYAKALLEAEAGFDGTALIVSSDYHLYRCMFIARRLGFAPEGCGSRLQYWLRPFGHVRETASVLREWVIPEKT